MDQVAPRIFPIPEDFRKLRPAISVEEESAERQLQKPPAQTVVNN
jgi:hypothetical protein